MIHCKDYSLGNLSQEFEGIVYTEKWLPINGYEGIYEISDFGRVKNILKNKIITQTPTDKRGYLRVTLNKNKAYVSKYVHILVGLHFIPNDKNKRTVNHKKGIKGDNVYFMLEWNTYSENHKHAYKELGRVHSMKGVTGYKNKRSKELVCVDTGIKYGSLSEAGRLLKIPFQNISKVCKGKRSSTHGLTFQYTNG